MITCSHRRDGAACAVARHTSTAHVSRLGASLGSLPTCSAPTQTQDRCRSGDDPWGVLYGRPEWATALNARSNSRCSERELVGGARGMWTCSLPATRQREDRAEISSEPIEASTRKVRGERSRCHRRRAPLRHVDLASSFRAPLPVTGTEAGGSAAPGRWTCASSTRSENNPPPASTLRTQNFGRLGVRRRRGSVGTRRVRG